METSDTILRALNSSSKFGQRQHCPGSAFAEKGLPELDSEYAKEGTLLHLHMADPKLSRAKLDVDQREVLERSQRAIDKFLEATKQRLGISEDAKTTTMVEREFILCDADGEPVISHAENVPGHPDVVYVWPEFRVACIVDHKFGRKEVTCAWLNLQLRSYAVMLSDLMDLETVVVAISQPWAKSPNDFHSAEYSKASIPGFRQELIDIIRATEDPKAERHASVEACTYCKACAYCPLAIEAATESAVVKVNEVSIPELEALGPTIELAKKVIDQWTKRMKYVADEYPEKLTKYRLTEAKSRRTIPNVTLAKKALLASEIGFTDTILDQCSTLSAKDLCDHAANVAKFTAQSAEEWLKNTLGPLMVKKPMERSLEKIPVSVHTAKQ